MAKKWNSSCESGRSDVCLAMTDSADCPEVVRPKSPTTDVSKDGAERTASTSPGPSSTAARNQDVAQVERLPNSQKPTDVVEGDTFHGSQQSFEETSQCSANEAAPPLDIYCPSDTALPEEHVAKNQDAGVKETPIRPFSNLSDISHVKSDISGSSDYFIAHGKMAPFEVDAVTSLTLSSHRERDASCSDTALPLCQPPLQDRQKNQTLTSRQASDGSIDVNATRQALPVVENGEENMAVCTILHQAPPQQQCQPGQILTQAADSEVMEVKKTLSKYHQSRPQDLLKSHSFASSSHDTISDTIHANDRDNEETTFQTNSENTITTPRTTTNLKKTIFILPENPMLISRQEKDVELLQKSKLVTLSEESEILDNNHMHNDNTASISSHEPMFTKTAVKTHQCNITEVGMLSSLQQHFPCLPVNSSDVTEMKKDTKIIASHTPTGPVRRSPRSHNYQNTNLNDVVKNVESFVLRCTGKARPEFIESKNESLAGAPGLLSSISESCTQSGSQDTGVKLETGDSCSPLLVPGTPADKDFTKPTKTERKKGSTASKSKCRRQRKNIDTISEELQTRKVDRTSSSTSLPLTPNQILHIQKPKKSSVKKKNLKKEPTDEPPSHPKELSGLLHETVIDYNATSLLATCDQLNHADALKTPPRVHKRNSKMGRRPKNEQKTQKELRKMTFDQDVRGECERRDLESNSTHNQEKEVKGELSATEEPRNPQRGSGQRRSRTEQKCRKKQTVACDLANECDQPEQFASRQPNIPPIEIKTESDQNLAMPIEVTMTKASMKRKLPLQDMENAKRTVIHQTFAEDDSQMGISSKPVLQNASFTGKNDLKNRVKTNGAKRKRKAVKEKLKTTRVIIKSDGVDNHTGAVKPKRTIQSARKKNMNAQKQRSNKQKCEGNPDTLVHQKAESKSNVIIKNSDLKPPCHRITRSRLCRESEVASIKDALSTSALLESNCSQYKCISNKDSVTVKPEQDSSELSPEIIVPHVNDIANKQVQQGDSTQSDPLIAKRQDKKQHSQINNSTDGFSFYSSLCIQENTCSSTMPKHVALKRDDTENLTSNTELKYSFEFKPTVGSQQKLKRKSLQCRFCCQSFRHISAFTVHRRIHTGGKPYRCWRCGKSFPHMSKLQTHSRTHRKPEAIQCPLCIRKCMDKDDLISHLEIHIQKAKKLNVTNKARKGSGICYQQSATSTDSCTTPRGKAVLQCQACLKQFLNGATFKMHQQICNKVKCKVCETCGKRFCKSSSLQSHEKTHWPLKPYACTVCGEGFISLKELEIHSHMHSGVMPFVCAHCGLPFNAIAALRSHQFSRLCLEERNQGDRHNADIGSSLVMEGPEGQIKYPLDYKCPICRQLLHHWCHYVLHLQTHSKGQQYLCKTCGQQYDWVHRSRIHCKACCKMSGEERACKLSLSKLCMKPNTTVAGTLEPQFASTSNDVNSHKQPSVSSPLETTEEEIADVLPMALSSRGTSPHRQSVSSCLDKSPHSPSNSSFENAHSALPSVISCGSEHVDQLPARINSHPPIRRHCGRYSCRKSRKSFNQRNKFRFHRGLHRHSVHPFSCAQCSLKFRFFGLYTDHLLQHAAQRPYACTICPKAFVTVENLKNHHSEYHRLHDSAKCSTCGKHFTSLTKLKRHSLLHKGVSSHVCLPCNLSFASKSVLQNHLKNPQLHPRIPLPERPIEPLLFPYHCRKCKAKFTSADLLESHQVCHLIAGRKPSSPSAGAASRLVIPTPHADTQAAICKLHQQVHQLPVSSKKHLFRYPHPDRLYIVPVVSSDPPVVISDTEEENVISPSVLNVTSESMSPVVNERRPRAIHNPSDRNALKTLQPSALFMALGIAESEQAESSHVSQTNTLQSTVVHPLSHCSWSQGLIQSKSGENSSSSSDVDLTGGCDNGLTEASVMTQKDKDWFIDVHSCALCTEHFADVSKLHEHYLDHARRVC